MNCEICGGRIHRDEDAFEIHCGGYRRNTFFPLFVKKFVAGGSIGVAHLECAEIDKPEEEELWDDGNIVRRLFDILGGDER